MAWSPVPPPPPHCSYGPQWLGAGQDRDKAVRIGWIGLAAVTVVTMGVIGMRVAQLRGELGL